MPAEYLGREDGSSNSATREVPVASGVTVTNRDLVYYVGGRVSSASVAGAKLLGQVLGGDSKLKGRSARTAQGQTISATGNAGGTVKVLVNQEPSARYLLKMATGTASAADEGKYFNLAGATGAQVVTNTPSTTVGQLVLLKANPGIRGTDNTYGIFRIALNANDTEASA